MSQEAILITNVKVDKIPFHKRVFIEHCQMHPFNPASRAEFDALQNITSEIERYELHPFHVARPRPTLHHLDAPSMEMEHEVDHYYIYADKAVQEQLGLVYEVWDNLKIEVERYRIQIHKMNETKRQRKAEGWWKRVHRGMVNEL